MTGDLPGPCSGRIQGYNAQAAVNDAQLILAAFLTQELNDVHQLLRAIAATRPTWLPPG